MNPIIANVRLRLSIGRRLCRHDAGLALVVHLGLRAAFSVAGDKRQVMVARSGPLRLLVEPGLFTVAAGAPWLGWPRWAGAICRGAVVLALVSGRLRRRWLLADAPFPPGQLSSRLLGFKTPTMVVEPAQTYCRSGYRGGLPLRSVTYSMGVSLENDLSRCPVRWSSSPRSRAFACGRRVFLDAERGNSQRPGRRPRSRDRQRR